MTYRSHAAHSSPPPITPRRSTRDGAMTWLQARADDDGDDGGGGRVGSREERQVDDVRHGGQLSEELASSRAAHARPTLHAAARQHQERQRVQHRQVTNGFATISYTAIYVPTLITRARCFIILRQ